MTFEISLADFLTKNRMSSELWERANISWDSLCLIATDHLARQTELSETAELCARVMQKLPKVHSVRWRVKNAEHLLEKIIRKRAAGGDNNKYLAISLENYHEIVTDLVGLRALHLFKDECFEIDTALRDSFALLQDEQPVAYVRAGDPPELIQRFEEAGHKVQQHAAGYRSVHYVVVSRPLHRQVAVEFQVRTIFEEGWSEIDHRIRYPNFSSDPQIAYFLRILNGLAGSADEMGSFVCGLVNAMEVNQRQVVEANENYELTLRKLETTVAELAMVRETKTSTDVTVDRLKRELTELREASAQAATARAQRADALTPAALARLGIQDVVRSPLGFDALRNSGLSVSSEQMLKRAALGLDLTDTLKRAALRFDSTDMVKRAAVGLDLTEMLKSGALGLDSTDMLKRAAVGLDLNGMLKSAALGPSSAGLIQTASRGLSATDLHNTAGLDPVAADVSKMSIRATDPVVRNAALSAEAQIALSDLDRSSSPEKK
jgi:putative GTP pyrophosphokinase